MFRMLNKRGQNTVEYGILIGVIVAAAVAMQVYVNRGFSARIKDAVDYSMNSDTSGVFNTSQYVPYYMESSTVTTQDATEHERMFQGGALRRDLEGENMTRRGYMIAGNYSDQND